MKVTLRSVNQFLLFSVLATVVLYYSRTLVIPVVLAAFLAMLMAPLCSKLDKKLPRVLAALSCVFLLMVAIATIFTLISLQVINFTKDMPKIQKKADQVTHSVQSYVDEKFSISPEQQTGYIKKQMKSVGESAGAMAGMLIGGIAGALSGMVMTLVFTFLLLFGKEKYEIFFIKLFKEQDASHVRKVLDDITKVSQQYLTGRMISMSIQAVLFSTGLMIIGIDNAILLGCTAALLTIIPYVGPVLGGLFPVLMSLVTEDSMDQTYYVIALLFLVQTMDNYFIEPNVVGGKVSLGAMATIFIIIVGGTLWGVVGMVLFVPTLGIVKIICNHVPSLHAYGYLIGDPDENEPSRMGQWIKKTMPKKMFFSK
ncbi:MAG: AI-2E family transporter [Cytophagales bacterium]|nr:AI-2E family transporter [Cytophaga sp.]